MMFVFFHTKHLIITSIFVIIVLIHNFTSSALKREVVYRVYDTLKDDCLVDEIPNLKLGAGSTSKQSFAKFKMKCEEEEEEQDARVKEQLKECVIPTITTTTGKSNKIAVIKLRLNYLDQSNFYHTFAMESAWWCLYMAIKNLEPMYRNVIIEPTTTNLTHSGAIGLLKTFSKASMNTTATKVVVVDVYDVYGPSATVYHSRQIGFKLPWPLWSHTHFEKNLKPHNLTMEMAKYIINSCPKSKKKIDVLLIQRTKSRRLLDDQTGKFETIIESLLQLTPNVKVIDFTDNDDFCKTVSLIQSSKVIIGVHGAGLTNLAWAKPSTLVVEILMRPGFQKVYFKSEYTNMARFFGVNYKYFDSSKVYPQLCGIYCEMVFINTTELKENLKSFLP